MHQDQHYPTSLDDATSRWSHVSRCCTDGMSASARSDVRNVNVAPNEDSDSDLDLFEQEQGDIAAR